MVIPDAFESRDVGTSSGHGWQEFLDAVSSEIRDHRCFPFKKTWKFFWFLELFDDIMHSWQRNVHCPFSVSTFWTHVLCKTPGWKYLCISCTRSGSGFPPNVAGVVRNLLDSFGPISDAPFAFYGHTEGDGWVWSLYRTAPHQQAGEGDSRPTLKELHEVK